MVIISIIQVCLKHYKMKKLPNDEKQNLVKNSVEKPQDENNNMKKIIKSDIYKFIAFTVLFLLSISMNCNKKVEMQKKDLDRLLERLYSDNSVFKNKERDDSVISINIIDSFITVTIDNSDTLFNQKYCEFHRYVAADDNKIDFTVKYKYDSKLPTHPVTGKDMKLNERKQILVFMPINNYGNLLKAAYIDNIGFLSDLNGKFMGNFQENDSVYAHNYTTTGPLILKNKKSKSRKVLDPFSLENMYLNKNEIQYDQISVYDYLYYLLLKFIFFKEDIDVTGNNGLITLSPEKIGDTVKDKYLFNVKYNDFVSKEIADEMLSLGKAFGFKVRKENVTQSQ